MSTAPAPRRHDTQTRRDGTPRVRTWKRDRFGAADRLLYQPTDTEWLEARRQGIGGSDAAALLGLHPHLTPLGLWLEKTSPHPPDPSAPSLAAELGHVLEPFIRDKMMAALNVYIKSPRILLRSQAHPVLLASPDGWIRHKVRRELVEYKTIAPWAWREYRDGGLPPHWVAQAQHYLTVTGYERVWFGVLVGHEEVVIRPVERDEAWIAQWVPYAEAWWTVYIVNQQAPPADGTPETAKRLAQRWMPTHPDPIALPEDARRHLEAYHRATQAIAEAKAAQQEAAAALKLLLADHEAGVLDDWRVTWRPKVTRTVTDWSRVPADVIRVTESRSFRVHPPQETKNEAAGDGGGQEVVHHGA